jgi:hypothetical protein
MNEKKSYQKCNLIFIVKILIGLKKNKQTSKVTNNIQRNVETASRRPFNTYRHFVHCAQ